MVILFPIFTYLYFSLLVTTCPAVYTKVGCFRDDMSNPRPLPELLFTDRDPSVKKYSNIPVDWQKWDSYLKDLVCRCAKEAKVLNYQFFSIQFYGKLNLKAISKEFPMVKRISLVIWATELDTGSSSSMCQPVSMNNRPGKPYLMCRYRAREHAKHPHN